MEDRGLNIDLDISEVASRSPMGIQSVGEYIHDLFSITRKFDDEQNSSKISTHFFAIKQRVSIIILNWIGLGAADELRQFFEIIRSELAKNKNRPLDGVAEISNYFKAWQEIILAYLTTNNVSHISGVANSYRRNMLKQIILLMQDAARNADDYGNNIKNVFRYADIQEAIQKTIKDNLDDFGYSGEKANDEIAENVEFGLIAWLIRWGAIKCWPNGAVEEPEALTNADFELTEIGFSMHLYINSDGTLFSSVSYHQQDVFRQIYLLITWLFESADSKPFDIDSHKIKEIFGEFARQNLIPKDLVFELFAMCESYDLISIVKNDNNSIQVKKREKLKSYYEDLTQIYKFTPSTARSLATLSMEIENADQGKGR